MALSIKSDRADRLARDLVALTGESLTEAVETSLAARLVIEQRKRRPLAISDIVDRFARLPVLDERSPDEILGYGDTGLPS